MRIERGKIDGPVRVDDELKLQGMGSDRAESTAGLVDRI
jgi:hypothetical protein